MIARTQLCACAALVALAGLTGSAAAKPAGRHAKADSKPLTAEAINNAAFAPPAGKTASKGGARSKTRPDPLTLRAQVLLDRARFSPGAIDGREGDTYRGALSAFAVAQGLPATTRLTPELWEKLQATDAKPAVQDYTLTQADADGPYVARIPPKLEDQAALDGLAYTNPREMLAERFHMSRDLVSALNPDKPLDKPGTVILVAAVDPLPTGKPKGKDIPQDRKVERIEVGKKSRDVRVLGADGKLLAYYPASIGSTEKPAPSGETEVKSVALDPVYTYDPKYAFKGVTKQQKFTIRPGPNNPVGVAWIDLAVPSYGIHGTSEPEKVGKTESHGCIRLTNWDVRDLAEHVARGVKVAFKED